MEWQLETKELKKQAESIYDLYITDADGNIIIEEKSMANAAAEKIIRD